MHQPPVNGASLFEEGDHEARRHRWIESEKAGCDLGEAAIRQWIRDHWTSFLRSKWLEHLHGKHFWMELPRDDFGLLARRFQERSELLQIILDQFKVGRENLDIINWVAEQNYSVDEVIEILEALDVNSVRLRHRFDVA